MAQTTVQVVGRRGSPDELGDLVAAVAEMTDHVNLVALNTRATVEALGLEYRLAGRRVEP